MALTKTQCQEIFKKFSGADGLLTPQELKNGIKSFARAKKMSNNDIDKLVVVRRFADDTAIYLTIKDNDDGKAIQKDIDSLQVWESCFQGMDQDGDQKISLNEFMNDMSKPSRKQKLEETFRKWDKDGSGSLSTAELKKAIMETMDEKTANDIIKQINDDQVTLDEFLAICN